MKIQGLSDIRRLWEARQRRKAAGLEDFSTLLDPAEEASASPAAAPPQPLAPLNTLLALQEVHDDDIKARREAVARGYNLLDEMEDLRRSFLSGRITESQVQRLENLVHRQSSTFIDPQLKAIMDDIELRAAVELAKLRLVD